MSWNELPALWRRSRTVDRKHCGASARPRSSSSAKSRACAASRKCFNSSCRDLYVIPSGRHDPLLDKAQASRLSTRGAWTTTATLHRYDHHLRRSKVPAAGWHRQLSDITPSLITAFAIDRGRRLGRHGMKGCAASLRGLLHYAHRQGLNPADLARSVPRGRDYRQASIPRAISWTTCSACWMALIGAPQSAAATTRCCSCSSAMGSGRARLQR